MVSAGARVNGLHWPLHELQLTSWGLFLLFVAFFYAIFFLYPDTVGRAVTGVLFGLLVLATCVSAGITTVTDPADRSIYAEAGSHAPRDYVPGHLYCYRCEAHVRDTSKHCTICQKCVDVFDHHCVWLNNCVGAHNYRSFLWVLFFAGVLLLLMLAVGLYDIIDNGLNRSAADSRVRSFYPSLSGDAFLGIVCGITAVVIVALGLVIQLASFHMYLVLADLTTYDYIMLKGKGLPVPTPKCCGGRAGSTSPRQPSASGSALNARPASITSTTHTRSSRTVPAASAPPATTAAAAPASTAVPNGHTLRRDESENQAQDAHEDRPHLAPRGDVSASAVASGGATVVTHAVVTIQSTTRLQPSGAPTSSDAPRRGNLLATIGHLAGADETGSSDAAITARTSSTGGRGAVISASGIDPTLSAPFPLPTGAPAGAAASVAEVMQGDHSSGSSGAAVRSRSESGASSSATGGGGPHSGAAPRVARHVAAASEMDVTDEGDYMHGSSAAAGSIARDTGRLSPVYHASGDTDSHSSAVAQPHSNGGQDLPHVRSSTGAAGATTSDGSADSRARARVLHTTGGTAPVDASAEGTLSTSEDGGTGNSRGHEP